MKKVIATISFLCYFIVSSGFVISSHYCMERLASVHLFEVTPEVCGQCGMDTHESNGCCRDEVTVVKLAQDQRQVALVVFELPALAPQEITLSDFLAANTYNVNEQPHFHNHSPPLLSAQDIYLQNHVFRI